MVCGLEVPYKMGLSAGNCREGENTFLYPCGGGEIHINWMFPKGWTNSKCLYSGIYLI